jgi:TolA-binding protein
MPAAIVMTLLLASLVVACGGGADDLLDTAKLEELQNNRPHARQLFEQVLRDYPGTAQAREAEARLRALERE